MSLVHRFVSSTLSLFQLVASSLSQMHFSESAKSSVKLCVGIASIILEGRSVHEDASSFENSSDQSRNDLGQLFVSERNFHNDTTTFIRPHRKVAVENTLETLTSGMIEASSAQQGTTTFDSFACGLLNVSPSTSTSTPKKHHFSYIDVGWDEYENGTGSRSVFLKSPSTMQFTSEHYGSSALTKLGRIKKSSSFSNIQPAQRKSANSNQGMQPGPHCENFLRKMGILKDSCKL